MWRDTRIQAPVSSKYLPNMLVALTFWWVKGVWHGVHCRLWWPLGYRSICGSILESPSNSHPWWKIPIFGRVGKCIRLFIRAVKIGISAFCIGNYGKSVTNKGKTHWESTDSRSRLWFSSGEASLVFLRNLAHVMTFVFSWFTLKMFRAAGGRVGYQSWGNNKYTGTNWWR